MQITRELVGEKYSNLSIGAKYTFLVLNELEQRFCTDGKDFFFRTDAELAADVGVNEKTLQRYKRELRNTDLVSIGTGKYQYSDGHKSEKSFTCYRILK